MAALLPVLAVVALGALLGTTATTLPQSIDTTPRSPATIPPRSTATTPSPSIAITPPRSTATTTPQSTARTQARRTAITPAAGINAYLYSICPNSTALEGCYCEGSLFPTVHVSGTDSDIDSCMASLSESGQTKLYQLSVSEYPALNLTREILMDVRFELLHFSNATILQVDEDFLGDSRNFTKEIQFSDVTLGTQYPQIDAPVLQILQFKNVSMDSDPPLRKDTFSGTPALERLFISSPDETAVLTVHRRAFLSLTKLQEVILRQSLRIRWGALHFSAPGLETLRLGFGASYTIEAGPGSIAGIPAGATVRINGLVDGGWKPSKFFNILRGGASITSWVTLDCDCDLAWIRYSSFLEQVDIDCRKNLISLIPLGEYDLSHCSFYKGQSMERTEL